jgi:hypothetical protein
MKTIPYEQEHVEALLEMLSRRAPCRWCPGVIAEKNNQHNLALRSSAYCVETCHRFIETGVTSISSASLYEIHPCTVLGSFEAIKRTWLALEEKGYI